MSNADAITEADLVALDALVAAATPGPWEFTQHRSGAGDGVLCQQGGSVVEHGHGTLAADAACIVALRNAAPRLLAEVRRARGNAAPIVRVTECVGHLDAEHRGRFRITVEFWPEEETP